MKNRITQFIKFFMATLMLSGALQGSSLKVYNMHDLPLRGQTTPRSSCTEGRDECSIAPYQSIFNTQSVTYTLQGKGIRKFSWKSLIGPRYTITVDLKPNENAKLELYGGAAYKFKSKQMQRAQES